MPLATRPSARRRGAAAAVAAALALALGACASEADEDPLRAADADADTDADTDGGAAGDPSSDGGGGAGEAPDMPEDLDAALEDAIDRLEDVDSADVRLELGLDQALVGELGITAEGLLDRDGRFSVVATTDGFGEQVELEVRSDGEAGWARSDDPAVLSALPDGAEWVEVPVDTLAEQGVISGFDDTFAVVPAVRGLVDAEDVGTEEVGGDEVRLIEGDLDWEAALDAATEDELPGLEDALTLTGAEVDLVGTVGLDGDGRIRLLRIEGESSAGGGELGAMALTMGLEVRGYDVGVEVEPPPEDEVVPADEVPDVVDELFGGLSAGGPDSGDDDPGGDGPGSDGPGGSGDDGGGLGEGLGEGEGGGFFD